MNNKGRQMGLLSEKENDAANAFAWEHYKLPCSKRMKRAAAIVKAEQTGIGFGVSVQCPVCKAKKDITDYDSW